MASFSQIFWNLAKYLDNLATVASVNVSQIILCLDDFILNIIKFWSKTISTQKSEANIKYRNKLYLRVHKFIAIGFVFCGCVVEIIINRFVHDNYFLIFQDDFEHICTMIFSFGLNRAAHAIILYQWRMNTVTWKWPCVHYTEFAESNYTCTWVIRDCVDFRHKLSCLFICFEDKSFGRLNK